MATLEELERRVQYIESEVEGEKPVTRSVLEQSIRNGDVLLALRSEVATVRVDINAVTSRVDHMVGDVVQANAALRNHGRLLTLLQQDVTALRSDATELRRGQEAINARLDQMQTDMAARFDSVAAQFDSVAAQFDSVAAQFDSMAARFDSVAAQFDSVAARFGSMAARFDRLESNVAAILAAVTPRNPA